MAQTFGKPNSPFVEQEAAATMFFMQTQVTVPKDDNKKIQLAIDLFVEQGGKVHRQYSGNKISVREWITALLILGCGGVAALVGLTAGLVFLGAVAFLFMVHNCTQSS